MRNRVDRIHLVGIGGSGMSGIAEVLSNLGFSVSGSDLQASSVTERLVAQGVVVHIGHAAEHVAGADVVVVSTAVDHLNAEVTAALEQGIAVVPRAEMLGELMRFQKGIAVAGTHGKTTTTSLVAAMLTAAQLDPTFVVGGLINSAGANAKLGSGEYLVAEADESDASFLHLMPEMAVVTNIDEDHMLTYQRSLDTLRETFVSFLQNLPFYGLAVLCIDDENVRAIRGKVHKPVLTYGQSEDADFRVSEIEQKASLMRFKLHRPGDLSTLVLESPVPGVHNVLNACAAAVIATHVGVSGEQIAAALSQFEGIGRRFQIYQKVEIGEQVVTLVDDYAHHPVELAATFDAARGCWPQRRLVVVFQPHRYSRTSDLFDDFVQVLSSQDTLLICDVYPAGEKPIAGATSGALCQAIRVRGASNPILVSDLDALEQTLAPILKADDVVLTVGAGNIGQHAAAFGARSKEP